MSQDQGQTQYGQVPWRETGSHAANQSHGAYGPRYSPPPMPPTPQPPKKRRIWPYVVLLIGGLFVIGTVVTAQPDGGPELRQIVPSVSSSLPAETEQATPPPPPDLGTQAPTKAPATKAPLTIEQQQAQGKAQDYLDYKGFSRTGLIEQLEFDGFTRTDATKAVGSLHVNWNAQAVRAAKSYLDFMHFSRSGLIGQLKFDGFTQKQAEWGVSKVGL